jgi:YVTN family beta-propeller protein
VHDAPRGLLYVSVGSTVAAYPAPIVPAHADSVVAIDPDTRQISAQVPVGPNPSQLALSDDGTKLYVVVDGDHTIQRIDVGSWTIDLEFPVGLAPPHGPVFPLRAGDIAVVPGDADALAVSRSWGGGNSDGVAVHDHGVMRPDVGAATGEIVFAPGQPATLYGFNNESTAYDAYVMAIGPTGVNVTLTRAKALSGFPADLAYGDGLLFDGANVVDAATLTRIGTVESASELQNQVPFVDFANNKLYTLNPCQWLRVYAADTLKLVAQFTDRCFRDGSADTPTGTGKLIAYAGALGLGLLNVDVVSGAAGELTALTPERILDTRTGVGTDGVVAQVGPGGRLDVQVAGRAGVPTAGVAAVVLNATITSPSAASFLTVWPTGIAQPNISNLNYVAGTTRANLVTVALGLAGQVSLFNEQGSTDVLFDVVGYYATVDGTPGSRYRPLAPIRVFDTRDGTGGVALEPVGPGATMQFDVTGAAGVPADDVTAIAINVTAVAPTASTYVTVWPGDVPQPNASNLNIDAGDVVPNLVIMRVPPSGVLNFFNAAGNTDLIADVVGYYTSDRRGEAGRFVPFAPFRQLDSRAGLLRLAPGRSVSVADANGFDAYVLNVTATGAQGSGYVTAHPFAASPPNASNLNYRDGQTVPNAVIVPVKYGFQLSNADGSTYVIADVFGAFTGG